MAKAAGNSDSLGLAAAPAADSTLFSGITGHP